MLNEHPRLPIFYILPKIHKPGKFSSERPIVSASNSALDPISKYIDFYLQPFVSQARSYTQNTKDFIVQVENLAILEGSVSMTMGITSLYSNVPLNGAKFCLQNLLNRWAHLNPPTHFILDCTDLIFVNNYFRFEGDF